ncbi:MAG: flavodoxin-dependent (E)-4-hydroxy-3-methylbut-2-enyl-diphosphate synthase [Oscillospiraceae bacterium]
MRNVKTVKIKNLSLDGKHIYIQSMLNARSDDIEGNVSQAILLEKCGCEILRVAIPDDNSIKLIGAIKQAVNIPLVADIHFDYRLALKSVSAGIDKIRINPGNIGDMDKVKLVADACRLNNIPIRIGVNSGSVQKEILAKYGSPTAEAIVESAMQHVEILNKFDFDDIVISLKSSDVETMVKSYRILAEKCEYPLHLGVTEAGTERMGIIKSAIGIGALLLDGIGETIRVSLTDSPEKEIYAAKDILKSIGKSNGVQVISCPTCGRTRIDIVTLANQVENAVKHIDKNIKVAVMGCVVNGPGEAKNADIGIAGGDGCAVLFKKGEIIKKISEENILAELLKEIELL